MPYPGERQGAERGPRRCLFCGTPNAQFTDHYSRLTFRLSYYCYCIGSPFLFDPNWSQDSFDIEMRNIRERIGFHLIGNNIQLGEN